MAEILHMISIRATPQEVYAALTEQAGLAGWWTQDVRAQPEVGSVATFRFGESGSNQMEILQLVENRLVHWRCCANTFGDEWINTEIFFELEPHEDKTIVRFSHRRWLKESDFLRFCSTKWATFLLSLKSLLEEGKGTPAPHDIET